MLCCHHLLVYPHQCVTSLDLQPCACFFLLSVEAVVNNY